MQDVEAVVEKLGIAVHDGHLYAYSPRTGRTGSNAMR
jgi:hypothetical protein